ncbi:MAG: acetyl-CoA carboxylase carboxyltransferase subunit alpha [Flavobacteriales bacterium]|jgi:acetyl-CoA carboxylase carboxyl transferase subunit alpha|nr:acetyl-CoA carboxylase carboxyltransferase subunit alpha [Flavobacteriales bacterium]|tara:strand:+ start:4613 stop:5569 length:957 start_codon:yes stop_codon:yes gene_type:complete
MIYLEFEKPIEELENKLTQAKELAEIDNLDTTKIISDIEDEILKTKKKIYNNLSPWQKVQVSRHPQRPYTLDYIEAITDGDFIELHGDRGVKDDKAMVGGWGTIGKQTVMFIGQQKGRDTKERQFRNFGMANPEGYRKALRLMKLAEKFNKPVITLIDTPGAFPGLEAEERGQGEAIARNILEMSRLQTPIICVIIGEGASGGALGIGVGDHIVMLNNSWYSVISPENCSTILWRSWDYKETAADSLKLTAKEMKGLGLVDKIIEEPVGGAHTNKEEIFKKVKKEINLSIKNLSELSSTDLVDQRMDKFANMGVVKEK